MASVFFFTPGKILSIIGNEMQKRKSINFVETVRERCRMCYTCVRECPAKAIRIAEGQAEIIQERCIGCGNCVRVCSQNAKVIHDTRTEVNRLLSGPHKVSACVAPSFPAAFPGVDCRNVVGCLHALGFDYVHEVAFGADLVARAYKELMEEDNGGSFIGTTCPALVNYIECYFHQLIPNLAPIVSPMTATAIAVRKEYGEDIKTVFVGPCLAKKGEDPGNDPLGEMDAVITFSEVKQMLDEAGIEPGACGPMDTDPPRGNLGGLFPVSGGILQAAGIKEDLVSGDVVTADGRSIFVESVKEYATGDMSVRLLELLCCSGCIMGSGMGCDTTMFRRRGMISEYVREHVDRLDTEEWTRSVERLSGLDLSRGYRSDDQSMQVPAKEALKKILQRMGKAKPEDELNCGACGYDTCIEHATAVFQGIAESEMCLPNTIEQLNKTVDALAVSNEELERTQEALLQSEKLASMGQLAAGIAHELNNPLGVILMYSHLRLEEEKNEDLEMITEQAERCKKIVAGLLHFARQNKVIRQRVDARDLIERSIRTVLAPENVEVQVKDDLEDPFIEVDRDQIIQVLTNLISNACAAMPEGGCLDIAVVRNEESVTFSVADTGTGISGEHLGKIFEPFFTTKKFGRGTGLGLAVSHGIVKMHAGDIDIKTNTDPEAGPTGTTFYVTLPVMDGM